ncbi:hypothetical protein ACLBYD_28205 [Rhodococcus sp. C26F]
MRTSVHHQAIRSSIYLRNAMDKLDARSRHEVVVEARRQGLLP